jgi:hypothetical protein
MFLVQMNGDVAAIGDDRPQDGRGPDRAGSEAFLFWHASSADLAKFLMRWSLFAGRWSIL